MISRSYVSGKLQRVFAAGIVVPSVPCGVVERRQFTSDGIEIVPF